MVAGFFGLFPLFAGVFMLLTIWDPRVLAGSPSRKPGRSRWKPDAEKKKDDDDDEDDEDDDDDE